MFQYWADFQTFPDERPNKVCLEELPHAPIWYDLIRKLHCQDSYTPEIKLPSVGQFLTMPHVPKVAYNETFSPKRYIHMHARLQTDWR